MKPCEVRGYAAAVLAHEREQTGSAEGMLACPQSRTKQLAIVKLSLTQICKQNQLGSSFFPLPLSFCTTVKETVLSLVHFACELSRHKKPAKHVQPLCWETSRNINDLFGKAKVDPLSKYMSGERPEICSLSLGVVQR